MLENIKFPNRSMLSLFIVVLFIYVAPNVDASNLEIATNRPMRNRQNLTLSVGQNEGDLQGNDDKVIQAGIDYLHRLGGGTLHVLPGVYNLSNAIYLHPNITLKGSGEKTILKKTPSVVTSLARDSDWFEYGVQVAEAKGFVPAGGIMLRSKTGPGDWQFDVLRATIIAIEGNFIFLDRQTEENFWLENNATAATIFPILTAENVDDVVIENIVLDGNREENEHINGNFSGGVFIQNCNRWQFKNVTSRNYNGDGFSFQVCDDIRFLDCKAIDNADLGFHTGSGSQRSIFQKCLSTRNSQGIYFCWSVSDGLAEDCVLAENDRYGISIGHRDTDNIITSCTIECNGKVGIIFRKEANEFRSGSRNRIENCIIRDNGSNGQGIGIDIQGKTSDIAVKDTRFENTAGKEQNIGIRIGRDAERITLQSNTFENCSAQIEDLRIGKN
jgi:hypothetical protein